MSAVTVQIRHIAYKGGAIRLAGQFMTVGANPAPVNISGMSAIELFVLAKGATSPAVQANVQVLNAVMGTFTAVIFNSSQMAVGEYAAQISYTDTASGDERFSKELATAFTLKRTLKYGS